MVHNAEYNTAPLWGDLVLQNLVLFIEHQKYERHFLDCNIPALQSLKSLLIHKTQQGKNETQITVSDV